MSDLNTFLMRDVELPLIPIVAGMEEAGYAIDCVYFRQLSQRLEAERAALLIETRSVAGADFNPASPKQVRGLLFEPLGLPVQKRTDGGEASTDEEVLSALKDQHPVVAQLARHRQLAKIIGTYCTLPDKVDDDGRFRFELEQMGADTGRFTSQGIIQTIPKDDEFGIRNGFVASPGMTIVAADYVQQELYVLAAVSGDPQLQEAIRNGIDLHGMVAVRTYGLDCEPNEVKSRYKDKRNEAKTVQFGIVYGQSAHGLAGKLGISPKDAQELLNDYFKQFPDVKAFIDGVHQRVVRDGHIDDLFGRRRYFPDAQLKRPRKQYERMDEREREIVGKINYAKRQAQNFLIQGPSATITKLAMLRCDQHLKAAHPGARLLLTLHDELQFEVPTDEVDRFAVALPDLMCQLGLERFDFTVPLAVEVKTGPSWGELQPYSVEGGK